MAKDGTNRGGRRVRAGAKPDPLKDKLEAGKPASRLLEPADLDPFGLDGEYYIKKSRIPLQRARKTQLPLVLAMGFGSS